MDVDVLVADMHVSCVLCAGPRPLSIPPTFPAAAQVKQALEATYMVPPSGTCVSIRVARSSMPAEAVAANTLAALQGVVKHIPKKWANVQVRTGHVGPHASRSSLVIS